MFQLLSSDDALIRTLELVKFFSYVGPSNCCVTSCADRCMFYCTRSKVRLGASLFAGHLEEEKRTRDNAQNIDKDPSSLLIRKKEGMQQWKDEDVKKL